MTKFLLALACFFSLISSATAQITPESSRDAISARIANAYAELTGLVHSVPGKQYIDVCQASWDGKAVNAPEVCADTEANIVKHIFKNHLRECGTFASRIASSESTTPWKHVSRSDLWTDNEILTTCELWARKAKVYGPIYR